MPQAQRILESIQTEDAQAQQKLQTAVETLAGADGDRVLDKFEAEVLQSAIAEVRQGATAPLTAAQMDQVQNVLTLRLTHMQTERVQTVDTVFTSQGQALENFRGKILGNMKDTIAKANGRRVDINMMVFAFTDDTMAQEILRMARENPNANFRLLTDWSQMSSSGNRQASLIARAAFAEGLDNVSVKFKKDNPYVWDADRGGPAFSHRNTKGLNHHKGFVSLIDGRPQKMVFGSFNWSIGAMKRNYENLMSLDRKDPDHRGIMSSYQKEFEAFWNRDDVALTYAEARREKDRLFRNLYEANGVPYESPVSALEDIADPVYHAAPVGFALDVNAFDSKNFEELQHRVGKTTADQVMKEVRDYGRFDNWAELLIRVPQIASAPAWVHEKLRDNSEDAVSECFFKATVALRHLEHRLHFSDGRDGEVCDQACQNTDDYQLNETFLSD